MSMEAAERETVIVSTDADHLVRISTAQRRYITKMRRSARFTEVRAGFDGSTEWAEFTIPASAWNPATGAKRKSTMTDEQKREAAARLAASRKKPTA